MCNVCNEFVTCRLCHDEMDRFKVAKLKCVPCGNEQTPFNSCSKCGILFATYCCTICNTYDSTPGKQVLRKLSWKGLFSKVPYERFFTAMLVEYVASARARRCGTATNAGCVLWAQTLAIMPASKTRSSRTVLLVWAVCLIRWRVVRCSSAGMPCTVLVSSDFTNRNIAVPSARRRLET